MLENHSIPALIENTCISLNHAPTLDQYDLFGGVAQVAPPVVGEPKTESYRVTFRTETLPNGMTRVTDYSHLPVEKRPIREVSYG